jgi:hypothetical protein
MTVWATKERTERILTVRCLEQDVLRLPEVYEFMEKWLSERNGDNLVVQRIERVDHCTMDVVLRRVGDEEGKCQQGSR